MATWPAVSREYTNTAVEPSWVSKESAPPVPPVWIT